MAQNRDAEIEIKVSEDKMQAFVTLRKNEGQGKALDLAMISAAINAKKFNGLNTEKIKRDFEAFLNSPNKEIVDYKLAQGSLSTKGKDRTIAMEVTYLAESDFTNLLSELELNPDLKKFATNLDEFPTSSVTSATIIHSGQTIAHFGLPTLGKAGINVFGERMPALPGELPPIKVFDKLSITEDAITSQTEGVLLVGKIGDVFAFRALEYTNCTIKVDVADDGMSAKLSVTEGQGLGKMLSIEQINSQIELADITMGVNSDTLIDILDEVKEKGQVTDRVFAQGKPAIPTGGFKLTWLVELASGSSVTVREDGSADYKNQDKSTLVTEGQALIDLVPIGQEGENGYDLFGHLFISEKDPLVADIPDFDDSIREEESADGAKTLYALKSGELKFEKNVLSILNVRRIKGDVGPNTGNIRFPGQVLITGNILSGYAVLSNADILVVGSVDACLLSSESAIKIKGGIKGSGKAILRAKKVISAAFAEQAMLLCVDSINLSGAAFMCNIKTNGKLTLLGDKGNFVGGICQARKGIEVQNLGSKNGAKTKVLFGQDYLIKNSIDNENKEIDKLKYLIVDNDRNLKHAQEEGNQKILYKCQKDKLTIMKLLEKRTMRLFQLNEKFEEHYPSEIIVRGTVFPGVVIESHGREFEIKSKKTAIVFTFDIQTGKVIERAYKEAKTEIEKPEKNAVKKNSKN